ncbi:MAG: hypothetical protein KKB70_11440 [Proteobacteria bacterium]|nr:hypothetical protein [Pseudomonadota bacterium]MBU1611429.1 hypothetical protein [Pseudomonadota bacterium]
MAALAKRVVLLGNGKPALDCLSVLLEQEPGYSDALRELVLVLVDASNTNLGASLQGYCEAKGVPYIATPNVNDENVLRQLRVLKPDLILSVNTFQILKKPFLDLAPDRVINFHNAPLPRYAGLNACTWAIVDGRKEHGITWHLVGEGVDTGDVLLQEVFPISMSCTALGLIMECIRRSKILFAENLDDIVADTLERKPQDKTKRIFHYQHEVPCGGFVDFRWNYEQLDCFVRGLNFHPMPNPLAFPKGEFNGQAFYIDKIGPAKENSIQSPGTVVALGKELVVAIADGAAQLLEVRDAECKRIPIEQFVSDYGLSVGDTLTGGTHA